MPCSIPIKGWRSLFPNEKGKYPIVFKRDLANTADPQDIPCGQCLECRLERSRQWAVRCMLESSLWDKNVSITLTYDDEHLPQGGTLVKEDFQKFMKRLRKRFGAGCRYYMCGEYGEKMSRPHYHACLFNCDFPDKVRVEDSPSGDPLFDSVTLADLWGKGRVRIGDVTFESAAYVARYIMKKVNGPPIRDEHGEVVGPNPRVMAHYDGKLAEYTAMSRRPGVARGWFEKFAMTDLYSKGFMMVDGRKTSAVKYFDSILEKVEPELFSALKRDRKDALLLAQAQNPDEFSADRLRVKHNVRMLECERIQRSYENA